MHHLRSQLNTLAQLFIAPDPIARYIDTTQVTAYVYGLLICLFCQNVNSPDIYDTLRRMLTLTHASINSVHVLISISILCYNIYYDSTLSIHGQLLIYLYGHLVVAIYEWLLCQHLQQYLLPLLTLNRWCI